jgi:hypothetical protein
MDMALKLGSFVAAGAAFVALAFPATSSASPNIRFGVDDDAIVAASLTSGSGSQVDPLDALGVRLVRFTLNWSQVALRKPKRPLDPNDPAYDWTSVDTAVRGLHRRGIVVLLTLWGTPAWANGGFGPNTIPLNKYSLAAFAGAVAKRYPWIRLWEVWNEPNQLVFLSPNSPRLYVQRLLNPTYVVLHNRNRANRVAGGSTTPRPTISALGPVAFMRGMRAAHARLDAYSHHPYPVTRGERPFGFAPGVCRYCRGILTLATLPKLIKEVRRDFGPKRIWLTEYGYQTTASNPYGVSDSAQARYVADAALRAREAPLVDILIQFLVEDEPGAGWKSGLMTSLGTPKPAYYSYMLPLAQVSRRGPVATVWGQVRPGTGLRQYRLERYSVGRWVRVGSWSFTNGRGSFLRRIRVRRGTRLRLAPVGHFAVSPTLRIR